MWSNPQKTKVGTDHTKFAQPFFSFISHIWEKKSSFGVFFASIENLHLFQFTTGIFFYFYKN